MILNLETDYAIRIVHYLAEVGERRDAGKIAEKTGVTLRFSLKILRKLVAAASSVPSRAPAAAMSWPDRAVKLRWER